jgi:hypothetical protein
MTPQELDVPPAVVPSTRRLGMATAIALLVAVALFVTTVLPAEYGIDPLGTGKALGLLDLYAGASAASAVPAGVPAAVDRVEARTVMPQSTNYKFDEVEFKLRPLEGFEYKYRIEKGGGMVYAWKASGHVRYEFHGEPDGAGLGVAESYDKQEGDHASGTFTAPTSGIHGWFWENTSDAPITIALSSAGFYSGAIEFRQKYDPIKHKDRVEQIPHQLSIDSPRAK